MFNKATLAVTGLAVLAAIAVPGQAITIKSESIRLSSSAVAKVDHPASVNHSRGINSQRWLMADDDNKRRYGRDDDDDDDDDDREERANQISLHRAKNLARQAAEAANGGIRVYRAEASMHGPANLCPYVDNGNFWTFTFRGGRPGSAIMTRESVVTVYKNSPRVIVAYNGPIRRVQQTQISSFTTSQRTVLVDLLRGSCDCNYLLTDAVRTRIVSQARSLSPGMQKRLLKGKGLPPGIARQWVVLPKQVNTYINLPASYDVVVVGKNVVLVDQTNSVVVDLITNVL